MNRMEKPLKFIIASNIQEKNVQKYTLIISYFNLKFILKSL